MSMKNNPAELSVELSLNGPPPTLTEWWAQLNQRGLIAAFATVLSAQDLAELVVVTWRRALDALAEEQERIALSELTSVPIGTA